MLKNKNCELPLEIIQFSLSQMLAANHVFPQTSDLKKFGLLDVFALIPHLPLFPCFPFKHSLVAHSPCTSSLAVSAWSPTRTPSLFPPPAPISLSAICITSLLCSLQQNPPLWAGAARTTVLVLQSPLFWKAIPSITGSDSISVLGCTMTSISTRSQEGAEPVHRRSWHHFSTSLMEHKPSSAEPRNLLQPAWCHLQGRRKTLFIHGQTS
nr:uncharacterized protein LOC106044531 [Anser cygnoides]